MDNKFNILLCFDSNYNVQGEVTMNSLLENTNNEINFYVIHNDLSSLEGVRSRIEKHKNTSSLILLSLLKGMKSHSQILMNLICQRLLITEYL